MSEEAKEKRRLAAAAKKAAKAAEAEEAMDQAVEDALQAEIAEKQKEIKKAEAAARRKQLREQKKALERQEAGLTQLPVEQVKLEPSMTITKNPRKVYAPPPSDAQIFKEEGSVIPVRRIGNQTSTVGRKRMR